MSSSKSRRKQVVGIFLFEGVELLDFCGPYEVFSSANDKFQVTFDLIKISFVEKLKKLKFSSCKVVTLGLKETVKTDNGLKVGVDHIITNEKEMPKLDILLLPGARDMIPAIKDKT